MSGLEPPGAVTSLPIESEKRLMLFGGRATPQLALNIAGKLGVDLSPTSLKTFSNGEVYCRYEESIRGADVFLIQSTCGNPETGFTAHDALVGLLVMIDAAVGALRAPGKEVGPARADQRAPRGADARDRRRRPGTDDGPPRRPGPGLLQQARRPHDGALHARPALQRPRPRQPCRRRPRRRPREAGAEVRREYRRRARPDDQGPPSPEIGRAS